jgi:large subunit ribosomal protein L24e
MPKSHTCSLCGNGIPVGTGSMFVKNDGAIFWFCSNKCKKNKMKLGRDPRKLKWTANYRKDQRA